MTALVFLVRCVLCLAMGLAAASAQDLRTITLVVPFSAGSAQDIFARMISEPLGQELRARVLVVNLAGMRFVNVDFKLPSGSPNQLSVGVSADGMLVVKVPPAMKASSDDRSLALIGMATAKERLDVQPSSVKGVVIQVE
jgi:hypothetical protein